MVSSKEVSKVERRLARGRRLKRASRVIQGTCVVVLAGCSTPRTPEYYEIRDKAIVDTLGVCLAQDVAPLKGKRVKDLALGYVELKGKLSACKVVVEESINLLEGV